MWIASFLPVFSFLCHSVLELRSGMGQMEWHTTAINKYYVPWGAVHNNTLLNKKTLLVDRWCNYYRFVHNCYTVCCCRNKDDDNTVGKLTAEKVGNICDWITFTLWYICSVIRHFVKATSRLLTCVWRWRCRHLLQMDCCATASAWPGDLRCPQYRQQYSIWIILDIVEPDVARVSRRSLAGHCLLPS